MGLKRASEKLNLSFVNCPPPYNLFMEVAKVILK